MRKVIYTAAGKSEIKTQHNHDKHSSAGKSPQLSSVCDHHIEQRSHQSEDRTGSSGRDNCFSSAHIPEQREQISQNPTAEINNKEFHFPDLQLKIPPKRSQQYHIIHEMLYAKMKKYACNDPVVFVSFHNCRVIHSSMFQHKICILCVPEYGQN